MSAIIRNPQKIALRKKIKELLKTVSKECVAAQSASITKKVRILADSSRFCSQSNAFSVYFVVVSNSSICQIIASTAFQKAERISVYLSLDSEVNTKDLLSEMFRANKKVRGLTLTSINFVLIACSIRPDFRAILQWKSYGDA